MKIYLEDFGKEEIQKLFEEAITKAIPQQNHQGDEKWLLTRKETKELLQVSYTTLHNWDKKGILKPFKIGNRVFYSYNEIVNSKNGGNEK